VRRSAINAWADPVETAESARGIFRTIGRFTLIEIFRIDQPAWLSARVFAGC
jgi:hypothetical protein